MYFIHVLSSISLHRLISYMSSNSIQMKYIDLRLTSSIWRVDMSYKLYPVCRFIYVVSSIHSFQFQFHHVTIAFTMAHFINVIYLSILRSSFVPCRQFHPYWKYCLCHPFIISSMWQFKILGLLGDLVLDINREILQFHAIW
jgi:hypothetical protein